MVRRKVDASTDCTDRTERRQVCTESHNRKRHADTIAIATTVGTVQYWTNKGIQDVLIRLK